VSKENFGIESPPKGFYRMVNLNSDYKKFLDIDYLKATGAKPHFFLDFIQLKLTDNQRMHFWHPDLPAYGAEEELHDHRYDFESRVLAGSTTHEEWNFVEDEGGDFEIIEKSCQPGNESPPRRIAVGDVRKGGSYSMVAGSVYHFPHDRFHRIHTDRCVTFLTRGEVIKDVARIIKPLNAPDFCPFETKIEESKLWEIMADLLHPAQPGYHLREIPKGVFGEASKILEEAAEFAEALEQGTKLMAMIELSDMRGAIDGYIQKNHSGLTIADLERLPALWQLPNLLAAVQGYLSKQEPMAVEDLEIFSQITQRAFRNGRR
jgi:hypothetical protein